jgi:hypothetical protein
MAAARPSKHFRCTRHVALVVSLGAVMAMHAATARHLDDYVVVPAHGSNEDTSNDLAQIRDRSSWVDVTGALVQACSCMHQL